MSMNKLLTAAILTCALGITAAHAQNQQPAEFPPASYNGKQYVDSTGCVFIRAGIDGNVSWIPRVARSRKTVCGFKPTGIARTASAAAAPKVDQPVQITLENPVAAPRPAPVPRAVATPKRAAPAPVVVRQTAPKPTRRRVVQQRVVQQPLTHTAPVMAPAPQVQTTMRTRYSTACPGASAISQRYMRGDGRTAVRCGPQAEPVVSANHYATAPQQRAVTTQRYEAPQAVVSQNTRIVPKHVAINRINTTNVEVPAGYKKVWQDGRLNPKRAEQSLGGRNQMLLIWTQTTPRRLIDQSTGKDMTASIPLVYPYLDIARQRRELGEVSIVQRNGQVTKRVVRHSNAAPVQRQPVYSSRSTPEPVRKTAAPSRAVAGAQFVQVGTFANSGNAQRAAQRVAQMGMPARIGQYRKGSKTYMTVQAGPFNGAGSTQNAMSRLRGAGFKDAFARK